MENQSNLVEQAKQLLKNRPLWLGYPQIEAKTGLPKQWLSCLARGLAKNPRVDRLETLIRYLETEK